MKYIIHNKKKNWIIITLKNNIVLFMKNDLFYFWLHSDKKYKDFETFSKDKPIDYYFNNHFPFIKYEIALKKHLCMQNTFIRKIAEDYLECKLI
jgi:hypothetical protein